MPKRKSWKRAAAQRGNVKASREVSEKGKYDVCLTDVCLTDGLTEDLTEELASLKTENSDTLRDVTEELASLKTENKDIVQGSVNLVTGKSYSLPESYLQNCQSEEMQNQKLVSLTNQRESCLSTDSINEQLKIFGSFHQNDRRFSDQSRGFQCTCNALCMISYNAVCTGIESSSDLDKILYDGDSLYQNVTNELKEQERFIHPLLSLDELPHDFEIEIGKFAVGKDPVVSGFLVDTQENSGLPSLHNALQSTLSNTKSCLLTIGAVCSAIFKRNDLYMFFDSHSHGKDGLSSIDGRSVLISFSSLDDLVGYMYAFYDSMRIDMGLQFDLLPVTIRKYNPKKDSAEQNKVESVDGIEEMVTVECAAETLSKVTENATEITQLPGRCHVKSFAEIVTKDAEYFAKVFSTEASLFHKHSMNNAFNLHKDFDDTFAMSFIEASKTHFRTNNNENISHAVAESERVKKFHTVKKRKKRTDYNKNYKKKQRLDPAYKTSEQILQCNYKQTARQNPVFKARECAAKANERQNLAFKANEISYQGQSKRRARQNPVFKAKECAAKANERQDPAFKINEISYQGKSKQKLRQDPAFKINEISYQGQSKRKARQNPVFKAKECAAKANERQDPAFKANEISYQGKSKQKLRQDPAFKANEITYQGKSKRKLRQDPAFKANEISYQGQSKQKLRQDPAFKANEVSYQGQSKRKARQNPVFRAKECSAKVNERQDPAFKANEIRYQYESKRRARQDQLFQSNEARYQRLSKQNARKKPFVLECERLRQQQKRQQNRKLDYSSKLNNQSDKEVEEKLQCHQSCNKSYQKRSKTIDDCIKEFHSSILVGPLYVCTCCHQTWFRKSVSMLKNTHIPARMRSYCTKFTSVNDEEWVCHTCLNSLKDYKAPRLSVANGMKWPIKPPELNLHQLEERLIALRIPFMQIRELPRGGQYSLKGNVINVPVDIQPK